MTEEQVLINYIQEYFDSGMWQYEACYLNKSDLEMIIKALKQETKWIPLTKRPMTDEEREEYYREWLDIEGAMIFDCPLPDDGQEVLVSYGGYVMVDTFYKDDGCYFEGVDIDDVQAWMPLPQPYK